MRSAAREISYAHAAETKAGRALIRTVENLTGRVSLIRKARGYESEVALGRDFWRVMVDRYNLDLEIVGGALENIPSYGPLIVISNHPYGILDGLMMGHILSEVRGGDFRIIAHQVFKKASELNRIILPISFDSSKEAIRLNLETRKEALRYLGQGGAMGIFPGGTVSTSLRPFGQPLDPGWRTFTAKMVARSGATVVPIYFEGQNSRVFQVASHVHPTLRTALFVNEFKKRVGGRVPVVIGEPIDALEIEARAGDQRALMDFLRTETYALARDPVGVDDFGYEFETIHRRGDAPARFRAY